MYIHIFGRTGEESSEEFTSRFRNIVNIFISQLIGVYGYLFYY